MKKRLVHKDAASARLREVTVTVSGHYVPIGNDDTSYLAVASSSLLTNLQWDNWGRGMRINYKRVPCHKTCDYHRTAPMFIIPEDIYQHLRIYSHIIVLYLCIRMEARLICGGL